MAKKVEAAETAEDGWKRNPPFWFIVFICVVAVSITSYIYTQWVLGAPRLVVGGAVGRFGDAFGGLNALFSGLAFALIIATLYLQHRELQMQRDEIHDSRIAQQGQREQLEKQATLMDERSAFDLQALLLRRRDAGKSGINISTPKLFEAMRSFQSLSFDGFRESVKETIQEQMTKNDRLVGWSNQLDALVEVTASAPRGNLSSKVLLAFLTKTDLAFLALRFASGHVPLSTLNAARSIDLLRAIPEQLKYNDLIRDEVERKVNQALLELTDSES